MSILPEIFLPSYIPPELLHREREISQFQNSIKNSIEDADFKPIIIQGEKGEGKRVFEIKSVKKFFDMLESCALCIDGRNNDSNMLMDECFNFITNKLSLNPSLLHRIPEIEFLLNNRKKYAYYALVVNNVEKLNSNLLKKIVKNCKRNKIYFFGTCNGKLKKNLRSIYEFCQDPFQLKPFGYTKLIDIGIFFCEQANFNQVNLEYIKYITAQCIQHKVNNPGRINSILKETYLKISCQGLFNYNVSQIIGNCIDDFIFDEIFLKNFFLDCTEVYKKFLRDLTEEYSKFLHNFIYKKFGISSSDLVKIYEGACDYFDKKRNYDNLKKFLNLMEKNCLFCSENRILGKEPYENDIIFFTIDLFQFQSIVNNLNLSVPSYSNKYTNLYS